MTTETIAMLGRRKKDKYYNAMEPFILSSLFYMHREGQQANNIMISKTCPEFDFYNRRGHFQATLSYLAEYENMINIYVHVSMELKGFNKTKGYKYLENNGRKIKMIRASIVRIIKNDMTKMRKYKKAIMKNDAKLQEQYLIKYWQEQMEERQKNGQIIQPITIIQ